MLFRSVRADVAADPARLSRTRLDGPAGLPVTGGAGDNRGLLAVADSLSTATATIDRGGIAGRVVDVAGYLADIVATQAASAAQAENRADADRALGDELGQRRSAVSGVNLDEELSRLIVYQRAYSVSARVMTVTNELLEELVNIGR